MSDNNKELKNGAADSEVCVETGVMQKIAETITEIKQRQERIVIEGAEWYDNGYWKVTIYDLFNEEKYKYMIKDTDNEEEYTFADFINEALHNYITK